MTSFAQPRASTLLLWKLCQLFSVPVGEVTKYVTNHVQHLNSHAYSAKKHYSTTLKQTFETSWSIQQQSFIKHHPSPACRILVAATMQPCGSKIIRFGSYLAATHASSHYWTLLQQCHRKATMRKVQSWRRMGCWKMSWKILETLWMYGILTSIHPIEAAREMMFSQLFFTNFLTYPDVTQYVLLLSSRCSDICIYIHIYIYLCWFPVLYLNLPSKAAKKLSANMRAKTCLKGANLLLFHWMELWEEKYRRKKLVAIGIHVESCRKLLESLSPWQTLKNHCGT